MLIGSHERLWIPYGSPLGVARRTLWDRISYAGATLLNSCDLPSPSQLQLLRQAGEDLDFFLADLELLIEELPVTSRSAAACRD